MRAKMNENQRKTIMKGLAKDRFSSSTRAMCVCKFIQKKKGRSRSQSLSVLKKDWGTKILSESVPHKLIESRNYMLSVFT